MCALATPGFRSICSALALPGAVVLGGGWADSNAAPGWGGSRVKSVDRTNIAPPEPVIFLELAADAMRQYRARTGRYPSVWHDLGMSFSGGPYRVGDPGTVAPPQAGNAWQPRESRYRYVIELATPDQFRIVAIGPDGVSEYELTEGKRTPRRLVERPEAPPPRPRK
jgi:hypothetical protein